MAEGLTPPRRPMGYSYAELAALVGCEPGEVREAMSGQTVGVDPETGEELVYPWDAGLVAARLGGGR